MIRTLPSASSMASLLARILGILMALLVALPLRPCDIFISGEPEEWPSTYKISRVEGKVVGKFTDAQVGGRRYIRAIPNVDIVLAARTDKPYRTDCGSDVVKAISDGEGRFKLGEIKAGKYCLSFHSREVHMSATFFVDVVNSEHTASLLADISPHIRLPECVVDDDSPYLEVVREPNSRNPRQQSE